MENRFCKLHYGKPLEHFCWTCQHLICIFCMQEHGSYKHKVNSLRTPNHLKSKKKKAIEKDESKITSKEESKAPVKEKPVPEKPKPVVKEVAGEPCIRCEKVVAPKEIQLKCRHWAHNSCLKEYIRR